MTVANFGGHRPPLQDVCSCSHAPVARTLRRPTGPRLHVISAEGAVVTWPAWGTPCRYSRHAECQALKARLISSLIYHCGLIRACSAGCNAPASWGDAPGWHECATLA